MSDVRRLRQLTRNQREALTDLLRRLCPEDWLRPTLCQGWSVRDVVAHLVAWDNMMLHRGRLQYPVAVARWTSAMARNRFDQARFNERATQHGPKDPSDLLQRLEARADPTARWLFERAAPGAQLAEYVIHYEDVARPLQVHRDPDEATLIAALDGVVHLPGLDARKHLKRHRWIAEDLNWTRGSGPELRAPALDILLALSGRPVPAVDSRTDHQPDTPH